MAFILHIRDFGRIKSADIELGKFTLLVGENNTGKSYLMQLLVGVQEILKAGIFHEEMRFDKEYNAITLTSNDQINVPQLFKHCVEHTNLYLNEKKEEIVLHIFKKSISIGHLSIEIQEDDHTYDIHLKASAYDYNNVWYRQEIPMVQDHNDHGIEIIIKENETEVGHTFHTGELHYVQLMNLFFFVYTKSYIKDAIYFPSSRTGLQLLYKNFFNSIAEQAFISQAKVEMKLTKPILDYMSFLQTYTADDEKKQEHHALLEFFEQNLIDGKFSIGLNNEIFYHSNAIATPLYLTSSMMNELLPFWLALTNADHYAQLMIDEVETSLHPNKQIEMARFLNRLQNAGMQIVVSTHSDTMAAAINLLYVLSKKKQAGQEVSEIFTALGYDADDLLNDEMKVYQFVNKGDHSIVEEVPYLYGTGFDFKQFDDALSQLLKNASAIVGGRS